MKKKVLLLSLLFSCFAISAAFGQSSGAAAGEPVLATIEPSFGVNYGTSQSAVAVVAMSNVVPPTSSVTYAKTEIASQGISVYQTSTSQVDWWHSITIPSGASVLSISIEACDSSATGAILFGLSLIPPPGNITPVGTTGTAETPGCATFSVNVSAPTTMNNGTKELMAFVDWTGAFTSGQSVNAIRVSYRRQVSPSPGTATFPNDVPLAHPFFRFVEALAAAGVTGGCGAGSYCPDQPVTRGQMAVFLSSALGLHWAP